MPSEVIKLAGRFKLKEVPEGLDRLFSTYREIVNYLITYAHENNITSFYRLKEETYKILRRRYPELPSHCIYTACQMATSIYKSYRKRKRRGRGIEYMTSTTSSQIKSSRSRRSMAVLPSKT